VNIDGGVGAMPKAGADWGEISARENTKVSAHLLICR